MIECLQCKIKNKIHFCIARNDNDDGATVDHKLNIIHSDSGKSGKLKNITKYDLHLCECHGICNDEISGNDVKLTLNDGTTIIGDINIWNYFKGKANEK